MRGEQTNAARRQLNGNPTMKGRERRLGKIRGNLR